jgi:hypothetical protein
MHARARIGIVLAIAVCSTGIAPSFYRDGKYRLGPCFKYFRELEAGALPRTEMDDQCILYASQGIDVLPFAFLIGFLVIGFGILFRLARVRDLSIAALVGATSTLIAGVVGFSFSGLEPWAVFLDPGLYMASFLTAAFGVFLLLVDRRVSA